MTATAADPQSRVTRRLNLYLTEEMLKRVQDVAQRKGISESGAARFLVAKGIDWWDALAATEREIA